MARLTTAQIATAAGVHQSTVSLALRGDPRLKPETVKRIQALARKMGYVPDPMLAALAHYRRGRMPTSGTVLAWVTNWPKPDGWRSRPLFVKLFEGARRRAAELGFRLDEFHLRAQGMSPARASSILVSRGIRGLLLAPQPDGVTSLELDWDEFSAVRIGPTLRSPRLHLVSNNQYRTVQRLCEALDGLGYRRIGYAIEAQSDRRMDGQWSAAYDRFHRDLAPDRHLRRLESATMAIELADWLRRERPDVVISCHEHLEPLLRQACARTGLSCEFALLGLVSGADGLSGMDEVPETVGATAVNRLVSALQHGERGVPEYPTFTYLDAVWVPGRGRQRH